MVKKKVKYGVATATVAVLVAVAALVGLAHPGKASATAVNCRSGLNTATVGWGYCDYAGGGTHQFVVHAYCWAWHASANYGSAGSGQAVYVSCPSWSHITRIWAEAFYG